MAEDKKGGIDWRSIGKWVARGAGYAFAPVTGGASVALGEGVAQYLGNSQATDKANDAIQKGAQEGIATYTNAFAPYMNLGAQSSNTLAGLMGMRPTTTPEGTIGGGPALLPGDGQGLHPGTLTDPKAESNARNAALQQQVQQSGMAVGRGTLADMMRPQAQTTSSYGKVRMQAPSGEEADVDPQMVSMFELRGARRI